jgi:capsular polysaccharide biosynthesis protein
MPGAIPLDTQIQLMCHAKVIVAPHGAALTNLVFCQPNAQVLELFPPRSIPSFFWAISNHMNLDYYCAIGEDWESLEEGEFKTRLLNPNHDDFFVSPKKLKEMLDVMNVV